MMEVRYDHVRSAAISLLTLKCDLFGVRMLQQPLSAKPEKVVEESFAFQ